MSIVSFRRLVVIIFIFFNIHAAAQQHHFVYLQTENQQPFYVRMNNKILSSSTAGYLIIPKLTDSTYNLTVGFPKNEFPEQNFQVAVTNLDEGYLIKNLGDKGWGLLNLQSFGMIASVAATEQQAHDTTTKVYNNDAFSTMLANVVKDSTLLQRQEPPKIVREAKPGSLDSSVVAARTDTSVAIKDAESLATIEGPDTSKAVVQNDTVRKTISHDSSVALSPSINYFVPPKKILSDKDSGGSVMIYLDTFPRLRDTVMIFFPSEKIRNGMGSTTDSARQVVSEPKQDSSAVSFDPLAANNTAKDSETIKKDTGTVAFKNERYKSVDSLHAESPVSLSQKEENSEIAQPDSVRANPLPAAIQNKTETMPQVVTSSRTNSDCKAFAENDDFLKLRKKMASENGDENMIKVAKKYFKTKCFSTEQIKNLSFLFLTDQGKYEFFDAAYAFVSDSERYSTLQSQFTDTYYLNRFKAMVQR